MQRYVLVDVFASIFFISIKFEITEFVMFRCHDMYFSKSYIYHIQAILFTFFAFSIEKLANASTKPNDDLHENQGKRCFACGKSEPTTWRKGPDGPKASFSLSYVYMLFDGHNSHFASLLRMFVFSLSRTTQLSFKRKKKKLLTQLVYDIILLIISQYK